MESRTRSQSKSKRIAIVGGGLVGSLNACFFAQKGYHVDLYELRKDIRQAEKVTGRSINLALSHRGRAALRAVGLEQHVVAEGIRMPARMIHDLHSSHEVKYGILPEHYIISIDRRRLNEVMLSLAEKRSNVELHFDHKLVRCDLKTGRMQFQLASGETVERSADLIIGCDGAHSAVRESMMKQAIFNYKQEYIEHGYIELETPSNDAGNYAMPPNYLHIWPRDTFMLIALPNLDRSFTTTLFMPFEKFDELQKEYAVAAEFFRETFPDVVQLIGESRLVHDFMNTKPSSLISIKCRPYHYGKTIIMGDAAHAMVPFYGQGMNAGFLDCLVFHELMEKYQDNFAKMQDNSEAIIDLAMYNYIEMRHLVKTRKFLLRKRFDNFLYGLMPNTWTPLYTMVTFSMIPYKQCAENKAWQDKVLKRILRITALAMVGGLCYIFFPVFTVRDYVAGFKQAVRKWYRAIRISKFKLDPEDRLPF